MQNQKEEVTKESLGELHPKELELIHLIRTRFKYGEVLVYTRDGLPYRILKAFESTDL